MFFKNLLYLLLFMFLIACETGAEEVEKPIELKKQINEKFSFDKRWSVNAFKSLPLGKINIASDKESIFIFDSKEKLKHFPIMEKEFGIKNSMLIFLLGLPLALTSFY